MDQVFLPKKSTWEKWIKIIPQGYKKLLNDDMEIKKLNSQIQFFYKKIFFEKNNNIIFTKNMLIPVYSRKINTQIYDFISPNKTVWNDTSLDDVDLIDALKELDLGLFVLGKLDGIEAENFLNIGIDRVTDYMNLEPNHNPIDENTQSKVLTFIKKYWPLLTALDNEFGKSGTFKKFAELENNLILCENLDILIQSKDGIFLNDTKTFALNDYEYLDHSDNNSMIIYVHYDEEYYNLIRYLCNKLFKWIGKYSLVKELLIIGSDEQEINLILKDNNLSPNLVDCFKALFNEIEDIDRDDEFTAQKTDDCIIEQQDIIQDSEGGSAFSGTKSSVQLQITNPITLNKDSKALNESSEVSGSVIKSKFPKNILLKKKNFGSIISAHMRPRYRNEVINRSYFDEDATPENQLIGERAEMRIVKILKENNKENVKHFGKNNKGFDIRFEEEKVIYYVEVKGLSGSWNDSDVLFSKAQFEYAQRFRERYFIYVVEHVSNPPKILISKINNPASKFTKMQLDHGWRNFSE